MISTRVGSDPIEAFCGHLGVLSVQTRLRILLLLRERNLCVGALARRLGVTQGAVSQHLKVLRDAGLVTATREGYYVHYRLNRPAIARWQRALDEMLERLREEPTDRVVGDDAPATDSTRKENACARRKRRAVVGRNGT